MSFYSLSSSGYVDLMRQLPASILRASRNNTVFSRRWLCRIGWRFWGNGGSRRRRQLVQLPCHFGRPSSKLMFCSGHTFTHLPHEMQASVLRKGSSETHLWNDLPMTLVLKRGKTPRRISVTDLQALIFWITSGRCVWALAILRFAFSGLSVLMPAMLT